MSRSKARVLGTLGAMLVMLLLAGTQAVALSGAPPVEYQAQVVTSFLNSGNDTVYYRRGYWDPAANAGWGYDKVYHKHGITNNLVVQDTARYPHTVNHQGGQRWRHESEFILNECDETGCHEIDRRTVVLVIEYAPWNLAPDLAPQMGVLTSWCEGETVCASWINDYGKDRTVRIDSEFTAPLP